MKLHFVLSLLLASVYGAAVPDSGEIHALTLIGTADGVSYYRDNSATMTWFEARRHCESASMKLASVNTEDQLKMLNSANIPYEGYWTSGRDANELRQFSWDETKTAVPELIITDFLGNVINSNYLTCLSVWSSLWPLRFYMEPCSNHQWPLCMKQE